MKGSPDPSLNSGFTSKSGGTTAFTSLCFPITSTQFSKSRRGTLWHVDLYPSCLTKWIAYYEA